MINNQNDFHLDPEAKQNLVAFFKVLREIEQEKELEKRLSKYSLTHSTNE